MKAESHFRRASASLQQSLSWYSSFRRHQNYRPSLELQAVVRQDLQSIKSTIDKLEEKIFRIAVFGLVSRGKSAVINAIIGENKLATGPINGVTKKPTSVRWQLEESNFKVELIDTPGLDEIEGEARAQMARKVAHQSDLILFVVSGDITRTEYQALTKLRKSKKPLILVFNKIDLYPDLDRRAIYQQLQRLAARQQNKSQTPVLLPDEIITVSAAPQAIPLVDWQEGKVNTQWEKPQPQIEELQEKLRLIIQREGDSLLALNALVQAKNAQNNIAQKTIKFREQEAEKIIWEYAKYKAIAVAINPVFFLDIFAGFFADLSLIKSLANLYGLPLSNYQARKLWQTILISSGSLLLSEIVSSLLLGIGKATVIWENPLNFTSYATVAMAQGGIAGYGSYLIGKAATVYLEQGCSWGVLGASAVIEEILAEVEPNSIIYRLRQELNLK